MSDEKTIGMIAWHDLTVPDAEKVRDFYMQVAGWRFDGVDMGGYQDYCMVASGSGETVAGVCHARGINADVPPQWLIYINVPDIEAAAKKCTQNGGSIVVATRSSGPGKMCVIRDPAGAVCALYQG